MKHAAKQLFHRASMGALLLALGLPTAAMAAQEQANSAPETSDSQGDIIVTAQRREQSLQDVAVSVTAIGSETMRASGITQSKDISKLVPGVLLDSSGGGGINANLTVRGVSQSDFSSVQESPNSIYIDDIYLSSANMAAFTLYDLQRIEVLRGPQGTLFGRASSGGLANFVINKPTDYFTGYVEVGYSSYDNKYIEGAVGGPISDGLRFRISGRRETADGWFQNGLAGGDDSFEKDFYGVRAQVEADLTDNFKARVSVSYDANPIHREGIYRAVPAYLVNGQPEELPANVDAYGTGPGNDVFGYRNPYSRFNKADFNSDLGYLKNKRFSPSLFLTLDLGDATITSISNYSKFSYDYGDDCDGGPVNGCIDLFSQDLKQWSQELRLNGSTGPLVYTAGFYYLNTNQHSPLGFGFPAFSGTDFAFNAFNDVRQRTTSWAIYGQGEYELTDKLKATLGVRYTRERKKFSSQVYFDELGIAYGGPGFSDPPLLVYDFSKQTVGDAAEKDAGLWSGKIGLDYKPNRDSLIYASVSRGVKAAGFNTNIAGSVTPEQTPFKSEVVYAYEIGSKFALLDRRLRINNSVFYYDYRRFQGFAFSGVAGLVGNYDGYFRGGEVEIAAAPTSDIDLSVSASYLESKLRDVPTAYSGVQDQESISAPRWTVNANVTKRFELPVGTLSFNWNGNYIDDRYASIDNNNATHLAGSFVHNLRVWLDVKDAGLEIAFFINNVSNVARNNFVFDLTTSQGSWIRSFAPPRMIGGSIRKTF